MTLGRFWKLCPARLGVGGAGGVSGASHKLQPEVILALGCPNPAAGIPIPPTHPKQNHSGVTLLKHPNLWGLAPTI